ncbi:MAG TPA: family 20 glycosylhydrolase [Acidobacteriota bacterium]|nr:family 20 glycosylhydrolase [Acidobacteriota bacterium]
MKKFLLVIFAFLPAFGTGGDRSALPVRGLHVTAPKPNDLNDCLRFIREALPKEGVNVLVVEFGYQYQFTRRPEVVDSDALSQENIKSIVAACRAAGVRLIPQINMLGHQSWAKTTFGLLRAHPEFDETPGRYPSNEGIYCRSYCPLHPDVHSVIFDLMDELAEACESDAFHVGMDEVFLLGEDDCVRCKGKSKADLFAQEVRTLHDHLAKSNRTMWMWGDRFLDGDITGLGKWEASQNGTATDMRQLPKDVVICDWHYEEAPPTAQYFAVEGFPVVSSPWRRPGVALAQLELIRHVRKNAPDAVATRMLGVLQTTWCPLGPFAKAYFREGPADPRVVEALVCFKELFREIRNADLR